MKLIFDCKVLKAVCGVSVYLQRAKQLLRESGKYPKTARTTCSKPRDQNTEQENKMNKYIEALSCKYCYLERTVIVKYSDCVFVSLVTRHAKRMRLFMLSGVACLPNTIFLHVIS